MTNAIICQKQISSRSIVAASASMSKFVPADKPASSWNFGFHFGDIRIHCKRKI